MAETPETPQNPPAKKRGKLIIILVIVAVVLAGAGVAGYLTMQPAGKAGAQAEHKPELSKKAEYLPLDPSFVVNFKDEQSVRFLQVGVTLMSHDPKAIEAAKEANPVIRNALLLLFSNQDASKLGGAEGKRKLQAEALKSVQKIIHEQIGRDGIEAVYFTSFVMQ
jgi:flagellar protein FliL